jgi:hypothetical protein
MNDYSYYKVGSRVFSSKILACIYATETNQEIEWVFYNNAFDKFDWTIEPNETLDELYDQRARELREKYDYIVISYSGGADSHNLLTSFLRQNLRVDEIIVHNFEKGTAPFKKIDINDKSSSNSLQSEHVLQTLPRLKELSFTHPNIKITITDLTDELFNYFQKDENWVENRKEVLNPAGGVRWNLKTISDIRKRLDKNLKIGVILGIEKPRTGIRSNTNEFIFAFNDRIVNMGVDYYLHDYDNTCIENFYWNPDCFKILCKQAHVIKRFLEFNPVHQKIWTIPIGSKAYNLIHERMLRNIIYSTWNNIWYQADKTILDLRKEYDDWFFVNYSDTKAYHIWDSGVQSVFKMAHKFIVFDEIGDPSGFKAYYKTYTIGKIKNEIIC